MSESLSLATERRSYDTAHVYIDPRQLVTVTEITDSSEPNVSLFQFAQFQYDPDSPDQPFQYTARITIKEIRSASRGNLRYPTEAIFADRRDGKSRYLSTHSNGSLTIAYHSLSHGEDVRANVSVNQNSNGNITNMTVKGNAVMPGARPPFLRASGSAEIGEHEYRRLMLGEPLDDRWHYDKTTSLVRFYLTSEQSDDRRNPWYIECNMNDSSLFNLIGTLDTYAQTSDSILESLFTNNRALNIAPFDTLYIGAGVDGYSRGDRRSAL